MHAPLQRLMTRVHPGLIRIEADEVTYPAHVILRFEIERALIEGHAEVDDIPAMWDERMQALLGLDTRGNFRDGPMQDIHWTDGAFGYFPCYSLGAMYAAQWFAAMRRELPTLDARLDEGDFQPAFDWLRERNGYSELSAIDTRRLLSCVAHLADHLEQRAAGRRHPAALDRGRAAGRDFPVAGEAAEVVDAHDVHQLEGAAHAVDPPRVAFGRMGRPAIQRMGLGSRHHLLGHQREIDAVGTAQHPPREIDAARGQQLARQRDAQVALGGLQRALEIGITTASCADVAGSGCCASRA